MRWDLILMWLRMKSRMQLLVTVVSEDWLPASSIHLQPLDMVHMAAVSDTATVCSSRKSRTVIR